MAGVLFRTMDKVEVMLVGSANMDLVVRTPRLPLPGETLTGMDFQTFAGGKGANQATAVGRLGGSVGLIAKVGEDSFGDQLMAGLAASGVETRWMLRDSGRATGVALITVDEIGQNTIVVAPGTNALLTDTDVSARLRMIAFSVLLIQLEIPMVTVIAAAEFSDDKTLIVNPAPARELPDTLLSRIDYLTPNETEAYSMTGILPNDDATCKAAAKVLLDKGIGNVLFTLGPNGSFLANSKGGRHFPTIRVSAVDTTGAGDAFNGAFANFLANGESVERAIHLANVTGALSTTRYGAQASMPTIAEVLARAEAPI